ncbi:hypothetical protein ATANTOWER_028510 [Ataeniobius toweri]|uniref:Uncharacterized protein n=1 Tax=Ataeniobius toweri TaxID=208326 RepID=A0ABU7BIK9_9TELE|nr:hypothetical protein [Ataeniobius toweri]
MLAASCLNTPGASSPVNGEHLSHRSCSPTPCRKPNTNNTKKTQRTPTPTSPPPQRPPHDGPEDEEEAREAQKLLIKVGSQMKDRGTQARSSGPYPSQSTRTVDNDRLNLRYMKSGVNT